MNFSSSQRPIFRILRSEKIVIETSYFNQFDKDLINIQNSNLRVVNSIISNKGVNSLPDINGNIQLTARAIQSFESKLIIKNSSFTDLTSLQEGGAINLVQGDLYLNDSTFSHNQAQIGGSISLYCSQQNEANIQGGAVNYNKYEPVNLLTSNIFENNYAPYGLNISSVPFTIRLTTMTAKNVNSGQKYQGIIQLEVVDYYMQRIVNDDTTGVILVGFYEDGTSVTGQTQQKAKNGIVTFDDIRFFGNPGNTQKQFKFYSPNIDDEMMRKVYRLEEQVVINEIIVECLPCEIGTYSININDKECTFCPENSECLGGSVISVDRGYWRSSNTSIQIHKCLGKEGCLGGVLESKKRYENDIYPLCDLGYGGNLCHSCKRVNGTQYARTSPNKCEVCPETGMNLIFLQAVLLILAYLIILVIMNIRSKKTNDVQVIMRIMTTYLQIISSTHVLDLDWPDLLQQFFGVFTQVGDSVQNLIYFDCFMKKTLVENDANSFIYFKTILIGVLPLLLILSFALAFQIFVMIKIKFKKQLVEWIVIMAVIVIYFTHPTVSRNILAIFFCMEIDKGEYWLQSDLSIQCWAMVSLLVLIYIHRLQIRLQPYKNPLINELEKREMICNLVTFYGSLIFVNIEFSDWIKLLSLTIIIVFNLWFILLWMYHQTPSKIKINHLLYNKDSFDLVALKDQTNLQFDNSKDISNQTIFGVVTQDVLRPHSSTSTIKKQAKKVKTHVSESKFKKQFKRKVKLIEPREKHVRQGTSDIFSDNDLDIKQSYPQNIKKLTYAQAKFQSSKAVLKQFEQIEVFKSQEDILGSSVKQISAQIRTNASVANAFTDHNFPDVKTQFILSKQQDKSHGYPFETQTILLNSNDLNHNEFSPLMMDQTLPKVKIQLYRRQLCTYCGLSVQSLAKHPYLEDVKVMDQEYYPKMPHNQKYYKDDSYYQKLEAKLQQPKVMEMNMDLKHQQYLFIRNQQPAIVNQIVPQLKGRQVAQNPTKISANLYLHGLPFQNNKEYEVSPKQQWSIRNEDIQNHLRNQAHFKY
ncbi:UNKNOWN [Stylonychia lemnae]|uniref:Transmembrane protein n=1 Tax=Stylonychia lemnae TaxID=5949 RepID=A0A077ZW18_STYLE|nr:UNKNOWN [Stylonychia lemnae]|eukprot:CDW74145.1 UNKNOWN [Stylonychia lemnae]